MEGIRKAASKLDCVSNEGYDDKTGKVTRPFGWWTTSFLYDYVALIVLLYMLVSPLVVFNVHTLNVFDMADPEVQRPLYDDQLTVEEILIMCVVPSAFMYAVFFLRRGMDWLEDAHSIFCTLATALMISNFTYFTLKEAVSRPRPDIVARCAPACLRDVTWTCTSIDNYIDPDLCPDASCCPVQCGFVDPRYAPGTILNCTATSEPLWERCGALWGRLITVEQAECQGLQSVGKYSPYTIDQGFTSFPSGHVINISGVFMFNWLYLAGKLQVYGRNVQQRMLLPAFAFMSAFIFAVLYVVETRISNNKHHISDCIAGLLVGMVPMLFVYPMYFQSIFLGGEPLRRPKQSCWNVLGHLCCRDRALQQPWPQEGWLPLPMFNAESRVNEVATGSLASKNGARRSDSQSTNGGFANQSQDQEGNIGAKTFDEIEDNGTLTGDSSSSSQAAGGPDASKKDYGTLNQAVSQV
ncbi:Phospholipid phosphatase 2 [Hondaea fermentalgiana]|uniref:Phospholipid phosphatase 2 n=1 Tax=Hondaea fermentalgiana TaxID=2315210 RepID=A0A2R5GT84_9STRA|nr:Phospholipid phosphatase 2 [Hondaea fermentalgiana]|eukprot:GBG34077.1 Phospholipid phosphatase 2 [Hondaea fermentalgiana]